MRKYSLLYVCLWLGACAGQGQVAHMPQKDGDVLSYGYVCTQGRIRVEYARMGGEESATLMFSDANEQSVRKVLPRVGAQAFALDTLQWTGTEDGRVYRLHDGGQMLPDDCRGRQRNVFTDKDDHEGTVQPDIGRFLR